MRLRSLAYQSLTALLALLGGFGTSLAAPPEAVRWTEGVNYFAIEPAQPTSVPPGKVEVTEVFSYACPACNAFIPTMKQLKASLPPVAVLDYLPAAFNKAEDWPMFQRAYLAAQTLGIADRAHHAMYDAVWKSGELAVVDTTTHRLRPNPPSIEDAARFYQRVTGTPTATFLSAARSFAVDLKVRTANEQVLRLSVDRTPTIIVNGKYRLHAESAGGGPQLVELVRWLVAKESATVPGAAAAGNTPRTPSR